VTAVQKAIYSQVEAQIQAQPQDSSKPKPVKPVPSGK
jgi:hypothetical protein